MTIDGAFLGDGGAATDISGMACMPASNGQRTCLVINDENKNAQFVAIRDDRMTVGAPITLIGDAPDRRHRARRRKPPAKRPTISTIWMVKA